MVMVAAVIGGGRTEASGRDLTVEIAAAEVEYSGRVGRLGFKGRVGGVGTRRNCRRVMG